ncbi:MAG: alkyl sulfatase dimerization domain-containing protein [Halieaceae bacterium]|nr:alkyl sulfatase dimerization domain-containing protein [Halieaceae bacterium]
MAARRTARSSCLLLPLLFTLSACQDKPVPRDTSPGSQGNTPATAITAAANAAVAEELDIDNQRDFEDATRGLIAAADPLVIRMDDGTVVWDSSSYDFVKGEAPPSVNPSLWRQAKLNNIHGLFEVTEGVYQLRGFDLANMSIIVGERGWIIVDPLTTKETAAAALAFAREHLEPKPVTAVLVTHSHIDHFGGVLSVLEPDGSTEIIAPIGFMEEATSENVIAGTTMSRRAMFMYGRQLERSPKGHVDTGLGKGPAFGSPGIAEPDRIVESTGEQLTIDGVEFVFQNAAGSEAPAELTFYLPQKKAFCGAEVVSRNLHNLYTLRGAKVRDARKWSAYIDEAMQLFPDAEVYFASHHWPLWGKADITNFLKLQRDSYRYIHDETLRLASLGYTPGEIAETIEMPTALRQSFPNRGYYGTVKHNARAVYQRYFGWYDGNPANLDPLPPPQAAVRYVEAMGGAEAVLARAQADFDAGEYRWVAEVLNHLVFAEPDNTEARALLAMTYDQLGYQAESGPWRDVYLTAALELRQGPPAGGMGLANAGDLLRQTPIEEFMQVIAVNLNGPKADGREYTFNFVFTDIGETHTLQLENAVLQHRAGDPAANANATVRITHDLFVRMLTGQAGIRDTLFSDEVSLEGSGVDLVRFFALLDTADEVFPIVTP